MALFTLDEARSAYREWQQATPDLVTKSAGRVILSEATAFDRQQLYDVFLSHSHLDSEAVLGLCRILRKRFGLRVYLDLDDEELGTGEITPSIADALRVRMKRSSCLLYAASENSSTSKWMPWELGYFDGLKSAVAVVPLSAVPRGGFKGQEYLGLYPYIDHADTKAGVPTLWVNGLATERGYASLTSWLAGERPPKA